MAIIKYEGIQLKTVLKIKSQENGKKKKKKQDQNTLISHST